MSAAVSLLPMCKVSFRYCVLGFAIGAVVALSQLLILADRPIGGDDFITQVAFEEKLRHPQLLGRPQLKGILIHPTSEVDIVSLQVLDPETLSYCNRFFAASRPYVPLTSERAPSPGYLVSDYLTQRTSVDPTVNFSFAWWESPLWCVILWSVGGVLVIGCIFPISMRLLSGVFVTGKQNQWKYDLSRFREESETVKTRDTTVAERFLLEELEMEMIAAIQASKGTPSQMCEGGSTSSGSPTIQLSQQASDPLPEVTSETKRYCGEYYPVETRVSRGLS